MADSSRIRSALDKSISLGKVKSGNMAIDPNGAYTLRLVDSTTQKVFIEVEIIGGRLLSIKSFKLDNSIVDKVKFAISTTNFIYFAVDNLELTSASNSFEPEVFVEYNLNPITVYTGSEINLNRGTIPLDPSGRPKFRTEFDINRTYYMEKVQFEGTTNEVNATDISVDTLNISNFKTDLSELQVAAGSTVKVPKLIVQTVGIEQMDVDTVTAKDIATGTIILSNGNHRGWVFSADPKVTGDSNIITLRTNIDND